MIISAKKELIFDEIRPTPSCHASTVLPLDNGDVLAAWFGGTAEGKDDVDIYVARRTEGRWLTAERITADPDTPHWNPVLFKTENGTVFLFFKVGKKISIWQTYFCTSTDNGLSWSSPEELVPGDETGGRGPVKNKPILLSDGTVLAPASSEQPDWLSFMDISRDGCRTWEKQQIVPARKISGTPVKLIQPTLWESEPGKVHALLRSARGHAYRSDSDDYGVTWSKAYPTKIKNPNSGLDVTKLDDGTLILINNPASRNWGVRAPLTLTKSTDNGSTWEEILVLEKRRDKDDEFSYPAIVAVNNKLYMTYTYQREKIAYWEVELG